MSLEEINESDLHELATGLFGDKGRVHLHICDPIDYQGDDIEELSNMIEQKILSNYKLWPTSHIAGKELTREGYDFNFFDENLIDSNQETKFLNRFNGIEEHIRRECLETYVRPMVNKKKARS